MKNQYIGGDCLKRGAWTVCRFKRGLARKQKGRGGIFEGELIPLYTLCYKISPNCLSSLYIKN